MLRILRDFLKLEAAGGILLMFSAVLAMVFANIHALQPMYFNFLQTHLTIKFGDIGFSKPLLMWVNEGFMAIFFLLIGLEVKREAIEGVLSKPMQWTLPISGALGGVILPAGIYCLFNYHDPIVLRGWAIPIATDVAFALGVLSLVKNKININLRLFLMSLSIFDDLAAIIIIAVFYTLNLSLMNMFLALLMILLLVYMNRRGIGHLPLYLLVGGILWICVLKSGVHATLSGVILAFTIPIEAKQYPNYSPLKVLESGLQRWVAFVILPLFAFVNAGVELNQISMQTLFSNMTLGIVFGLFIGKQLGILAGYYIPIKLGYAKLMEHASWRQIYGVALLCGIGFTMSLFISMLAFSNIDVKYINISKLGIILGSIISATSGYLLLSWKSRKNHY